MDQPVFSGWLPVLGFDSLAALIEQRNGWSAMLKYVVLRQNLKWKLL